MYILLKFVNFIFLEAVQVICNRTRGEGGVCQNMILYDTGGRGGRPKYDVVLCRGGGGEYTYYYLQGITEFI